MSDEQVNVEEIKERLKIEVEEEAPAQADSSGNIAEEFKNMGRQLGETLQSMWNSEERQRLESQVREGVDSFVNEVDKVIREAREGKVAERVSTEASKVGEKVDASDIGRKARGGIVQGLHWLSEELGKLADQFTPTEEEAPKEK